MYYVKMYSESNFKTVNQYYLESLEIYNLSCLITIAMHDIDNM